MGLMSVIGLRVGQVRVVFQLPAKTVRALFPDPANPPPQHLAYVEWFTPFGRTPQPHHLLYRVKRSVLPNGYPVASVVSLRNVRRSVQLFPSFGQTAPREYTPENVLDLCPAFFVNSFTDRHSYHTVT